ncbi:hypothetical protein [uncultured Sphingomonas sp.]|uniref:hypothetical protein n=1 Tax=uncultured Sphingomonas sp. TaxID=158754 RepID=UPI0025D57E2C|nr:hypothetical protein [uncultured Sphingomonas sp.]
MNRDDLSTAPRAVRLTVARALVDKITGDGRENHAAGEGGAGRLGEVSRQGEEVNVGAGHYAAACSDAAAGAEESKASMSTLIRFARDASRR